MNGKVWLGIAVSAVLLALAIRNVDLQQAWGYVQTIDSIYLIPSFLLIVFEIVIRTVKWQILLLPVKRCSFKKLLSATAIGIMANNVLPARAGEFVRAYAGARLATVPISTSLATIVIDRLLDGLTVSALFILVIIFQPLPDFLNRAGYVAAVIYLGTLAFLVGLIVRTDKTLRLATIVMGPLPSGLRERALRALTSFVEGLGVFRNALMLFAAIAISFAVWTAYALGFYVMFMMFGLPLSIGAGFVVLLTLTIMLTLPGAPGFIGLMEAGIVYGLDLFGVDRSLALALAVVYHFISYVPTTLAGLVGLWAEGLTLAEVSRSGPVET